MQFFQIFPASSRNATIAPCFNAEQHRDATWPDKSSSLGSYHLAISFHQIIGGTWAGIVVHSVPGDWTFLAAEDDWLVYLRDTAHSAEASCTAGPQERTVIAIHRGEKTNALHIPLANTWMEGCSLNAPELIGAKSSVRIEGGAFN